MYNYSKFIDFSVSDVTLLSFSKKAWCVSLTQFPHQNDIVGLSPISGVGIEVGPLVSGILSTYTCYMYQDITVIIH